MLSDTYTVTVAKTMFLNNPHRTLHHYCILGILWVVNNNMAVKVM